MSRFDVIQGVEGCCLSLDDTRIAGPKPWGGGKVIHSWETDEDYGVLRGECEKLPQLSDSVCVVKRNGFEMEFGYWRCSECGCENFEGAKYCMNCGRKAVER